MDPSRLLPRIQKPTSFKTCSSLPNAMLMGKVGAGKTTLFNKICGTTHLTRHGGDGVTHRLAWEKAACGQNAFALVDVPGTHDRKRTYKNAFILRAALTTKKLHTIFLVIKYDRIGIMEKDLMAQVEILKEEAKVVVMISHWDQCDKDKNPAEEFARICAELEECGGYANFICYSSQSDGDVLADLMYGCISNMHPEKLKIPKEEFFARFNVVELKARQRRSFKSHKMAANMLLQKYQEAATRFHNEEDADGILHALIVDFNSQVRVLTDELVEKEKPEMSEVGYYGLFIHAQKNTIRICENFNKFVAPLMSYSLDDKTDPRNLIKACPNCGEVWAKVQGCDGITTCGNLPSDPDVILPFFKYTFQTVNGKLQIGEAVRQAVRQSTLFSLCDKLFKVGKKGFGCGANFCWGDQPKLSDSLDRKLLGVNTDAHLKSLFNTASFQDTFQEIDATVDVNFHSSSDMITPAQPNLDFAAQFPKAVRKAPDMEFKACATNLKGFQYKTNSIITDADHQTLMEMATEILQHQPQRTAAVTAYTYKIIGEYLNWPLRIHDLRTTSKIATIMPFYKLLIQSLHDWCKPYEGDVVRVERKVHPLFDRKYVKGTKVMFYGYLSTTTPENAELMKKEFSNEGEKYTVFEFKNVKGFEIWNVSKYPKENEVLILPNFYATVIEVDKEHKEHKVTLQSVGLDWWADWPESSSSSSSSSS